MPDGMEAIIFTADGDMRQALNNLQVQFLQRIIQTTDWLAAGGAQLRLFVARML